ncbi:MAG: sulfur carrier protein ThiS [Thermacetogeniaceae bacterium]
MKILANGSETFLEKEVTVKDLLTILKVETPEYATVQLNSKILPKEDFDKIAVKEGDSVEFLYFMGGGEPVGIYERTDGKVLPPYRSQGSRRQGPTKAAKF